MRGKSQVGRNKQYSQLDDCQDNGWLHNDEKIIVGVTYKLKVGGNWYSAIRRQSHHRPALPQYLGSMEINYVPGDPHQNNDLALAVMRKVGHAPSSYPP